MSPVLGGKAIPGTQWQVPGEGPGLAEQPLGRTFAPGLWPALFLAVEAGTGQLTTFSPPVLFWLQIVNSSPEAPPQGSPASACGRIRCFVLLRCAFFFFFPFWAARSIGSSQARDQIGMAVWTQATAVVLLGPSFIHCARPGAEPESQHSQDTAHSIAPQRELLRCSFKTPQGILWQVTFGESLVDKVARKLFHGVGCMRTAQTKR